MSTPAVSLLRKEKLPFSLHEYIHEESESSYGEEAARKLGITVERVFKTLVIELDGKELSVGIVPVGGKLSLKKAASAFGAKKAKMAEAQRVERVTGYVLGGVSPLGQKKLLPTVIDESAKVLETIYVSGGKRGLEIELSPLDLAKILSANFAEISAES